MAWTFNPFTGNFDKVDYITDYVSKADGGFFQGPVSFQSYTTVGTDNNNAFRVENSSNDAVIRVDTNNEYVYSADLFPMTPNTYALGGVDNEWDTAHIGDVTVTNELDAGNVDADYYASGNSGAGVSNISYFYNNVGVDLAQGYNTGISGGVTSTTNSNTANKAIGFNLNGFLNGTGNLTGGIFGIDGAWLYYGSGTVANLVGTNWVMNNMGGTITNYDGFKVSTSQTFGTTTTLKQLNLTGTLGGTVTNGYGIYQDISSLSNYFAGNIDAQTADVYGAKVGIGTTIFDSGVILEVTGGDAKFNDNVEVVDDLKVSGELQGARESFTFSYGRGGGARYAKIGEFQTSAGQGYIMSRGGSIVSVSVTANVNNYSASGNMDAEARIGGTPMFQKAINVTGAGLYSGYATQARDTDTFVAGNSLEAYIDIHGTFSVYDVVIVIEVQFDT